MNYRVDILLFDKFESLDVFGHVEILGRLPEIFKLNFISADGGLVESSQQVRVDTNLCTRDDDIEKNLFVLGGSGTREKVNDNNWDDFWKVSTIYNPTCKDIEVK